MACHIICFVSFRFVSFRFVSFRFVSFRFDLFSFVSICFVSICFVSFRFVSVSFRTLQGPIIFFNLSKINFAKLKQKIIHRVILKHDKYERKILFHVLPLNIRPFHPRGIKIM